MEDGFRRRADLGLSKVDTEDPETRDGVRIFGGAAGTVAPGGGTEIPLLETTVFCATAVIGVAVLVVLLLTLGSGDLMVLLGRFASFDTCCTGFFCLPPSGATDLVGIRLVGVGSLVVGSSCCWFLKCALRDDMAGARDAAQHTRQVWIMRDSRERRNGAHEGMCGVVVVVSGIDYEVSCFVAWGQKVYYIEDGRQRPALPSLMEESKKVKD